VANQAEQVIMALDAALAARGLAGPAALVQASFTLRPSPGAADALRCVWRGWAGPAAPDPLVGFKEPEAPHVQVLLEYAIVNGGGGA
jgi:hypothetical protein